MKWTLELFEVVSDLYEDHTLEEISSILKKKYKFIKTPNAIRKAYKRYNEDSKVLEKNEPKVLLFDIETAPMLGYIWGLWDNNVALNQLHSDWHILSWSAKWLGSSENEVMYMDQRNKKDITNDKDILQGIWNLLDEADVVIGQNSKKFDHKKLNARFILNGMKPPSSYRHIDTLQLAKKHFAFTSNKLEYMTGKLCKKYKKLKHAKFSGFNLWDQCLKGNKEAWQEMELYNKYDVLSLEELYFKLIPWDNSINFNVYSDLLTTVCTCGHDKFKENGYSYSNTGKFQKYTCKRCGSEFKSKTNLLSINKRKSLKSGTQR